MLWRGMLADLCVGVHAAYVCFVGFGLVAILVGIAFRWRWVRNPWFRTIHIAMIGVVVVEALAGMPCPLTVWERQLRQGAGQVTYSGDFIGYWARRLVFFPAEPWVVTVIQVAFGLAILAAFLAAPPRWKRQSHGRPAS
jgi:hypothetical protein